MNFLFGLLIIRFTLLNAAKCYIGTDTLTETPCAKCAGLPIEVMLILDDSSSIRNGGGGNQFPNEKKFARDFVKRLNSTFGVVRVGAVFFSECMAGTNSWLTTKNYVAGGNSFDCAVGTPQSKYDLTTPKAMLDGPLAASIPPGYDNGKHWGTPLSVGYDFAREIMAEQSTPGRLRVIVMISDGEPTRPSYPPDNHAKDVAMPKWQKVSRCDTNATEVKTAGLISMTIRVATGQDVQAARNMVRWASEPRDLWAVDVGGDFDKLQDKFEIIMPRFCFFITNIGNENGDDQIAQCVKTNDTLVLTGENLYDMAQDLVPISGTLIKSATDSMSSYGYNLGASNTITVVRFEGNYNSMQGAFLEISSDPDCATWTRVGTWSISANSEVERADDTRHIWASAYDICAETNNPVTCKDQPAQLIEATCIRLKKNSVGLEDPTITSMTVYGKGPASQKPLCRFQSSKTQAIWYSPGRQANPTATEFRCEMPDTGNDYGEFTVEMNRDGGESGAFTQNQKKIKHTTPVCTVPSIFVPEEGVKPGQTLGPTTPYFTTPPPGFGAASQLEMHLCIMFFLLSGHFFYF